MASTSAAADTGTVPPYTAEEPALALSSVATVPDALPGYTPRPPVEIAAIPGAHVHSTSETPATSLLPDSFPIGRSKTAPLLSILELQRHLRILAAFSALQGKIRATGRSKSESDAAWAVFLARAVYRFQKWAGFIRITTQGTVPADYMPPLDVLMVWHSYMLNPRSYYEDCIRNASNLAGIKSFPLREVAEAIDPITFELRPPTTERIVLWEQRTALTFEPDVVTILEDTTAVLCPICPGEIQTPVSWITESGTGFAQAGFEANCMSCKGHFNREAMRVRRFCEDAVRVLASPDKRFLSGTLIAPGRGTMNVRSGQLLSTNIVKFVMASISNASSSSAMAIEPADMAASLGYKMEKVRDAVYKGFTSTGGRQPRRARRVITCYASVYPFSVELSGAVLRQGSFVEKIVELGWTRHDSSPDSNSIQVLIRSISRYHAFLDLMTTNFAFSVPTIDIDLSWHTHQLKSAKYREDTLALVGRTPDHDDKVEETALSNGYDATAKAWKSRFGVPYSVCGCGPVETPSSAGGGLKFPKLLSSSSKTASSLSADQAKAIALVVSNARPDLVSTEHSPDAVQATHPSEHDSVYLVGHKASDKLRAERVEEAAKRRKDMDKVAEKGKFKDDWDRVCYERLRKPNSAHQPAFNTVVPYWGIAPYEGYGVGGCAAYNGSVFAGGATFVAGTIGGSCAAGGCAAIVSCGADHESTRYA